MTRRETAHTHPQRVRGAQITQCLLDQEQRTVQSSVAPRRHQLACDDHAKLVRQATNVGVIKVKGFGSRQWLTQSSKLRCIFTAQIALVVAVGTNSCETEDQNKRQASTHGTHMLGNLSRSLAAPDSATPLPITLSIQSAGFTRCSRRGVPGTASRYLTSGFAWSSTLPKYTIRPPFCNKRRRSNMKKISADGWWIVHITVRPVAATCSDDTKHNNNNKNNNNNIWFVVNEQCVAVVPGGSKRGQTEHTSGAYTRCDTKNTHSLDGTHHRHGGA